MVEFTDEHFKKLGITKEYILNLFSMYEEKLDNFKTFEDLHQRVHRQTIEERKQEKRFKIKHEHRKQKWYRILKILLRSAGVSKVNDTMIKLLEESDHSKEVYNPPAIFPIFKFIIKEVTVGAKHERVSFAIFNDGVDIDKLIAAPPPKYQILIQNIFCRAKNVSQNNYLTIPHSEKEVTHGLMFTFEYDDIPMSTGTVILLKVNIVYAPLEVYTDITNVKEIVHKKEEPEFNIKAYNERAKKLSKASLPPPRLKTSKVHI